MIHKELNSGSLSTHKIILHMKKLVCVWILPNLTECQKAKPIRIYKAILKFLNKDGYCLTSKIITGDGIYMPFSDVPTRQKSNVWVFEDNPKWRKDNE